MSQQDGLVYSKLWRDLSMPEDQQWTLEWTLLSTPPGNGPSVLRFATKDAALDKAKAMGWGNIEAFNSGVRR